MSQNQRDPRIGRMFSSDRTWSLLSLIVLWALYAFVFFYIADQTGSPEVFWALAISGGLVLAFNTAAIVAMIANLDSSAEEIYGLDLHYLDIEIKK